MLEQYTIHYTTPAGIQHQHPLRLPTAARQVEHPLHLVGTVSCPYAVIGKQRGWRNDNMNAAHIIPLAAVKQALRPQGI